MKLFVMMPLRDEYAGVRNAIRKAASITKDEFIIADEVSRTGKIDEQIIQYIRESDACIVDITENRPNVIWEMGYAHALGKPTVVLTQNVEKYGFFDTRQYRMIPYDIENLDVTLTQELVNNLSGNEFRQNRATPDQLIGTPGHGKASLVCADGHMLGSPYSFFNLIRTAQDYIFLSAQNHYTLVSKGKEFKSAALNFLEGKKDRKIDIILCDPDCRDAISTWKYVNDHRDDRYEHDLAAAIKFFSDFITQANESGFVDQVRLIKLPFVPVSATFVDPELDSGVMVMVPNVFQILSHIRPYFVLTKKRNFDIFSHYWSIYLQKTILA